MSAPRITSCLKCFMVYEGRPRKCEFCGFTPPKRVSPANLPAETKIIATPLRAPDGWAFYSADFSINAGNPKRLGSVMLVRAPKERGAWHAFDAAQDEDHCFPLFVTGVGITLTVAFGAACMAAQQAGEVPSS